MIILSDSLIYKMFSKNAVFLSLATKKLSGGADAHNMFTALFAHILFIS
jgi:hypothetical protein